MTIATAAEVDKPRVISELRKNAYRKRPPALVLPERIGPKIAGELLWSATPTQWHVKLAEVRQGSLVVHCSSTGAAEFRLPLHHLSILATHTPRTFTLATTHGIPLATFQTLTEEEFQRWVRVLAVEVLRQTPLHDVRFLDIIGITRSHCRQLRRGQSEECLYPSAPAVNTDDHRGGRRRKDRTEFSQWLHCVKRETDEEHRAKNTDFDIKNMKIRRAQKIRPKLPFADTWNKLKGHIDTGLSHAATQLQKRSVSMDNISRTHTVIARKDKKIISDESGISSGDEITNTNSDGSTQSSKSEAIYVSVREKKKFFESLSSETEVKKPEVTLNRSSSIGTFDSAQQQQSLLKSRASSMQDLSSNAVPVRQIRRLFESGSAKSRSFDELSEYNDVSATIPEEDDQPEASSDTKHFVCPVERKPKETVSYANIQFCKGSRKIAIEKSKTPKINVDNCRLVPEGDNSKNQLTTRELLDRPESTTSDSSSRSCPSDASNMTTLLIQRKLQRGERKLCKLRIQIAEVEDTIKHIADDLQSIGPNTLKRRSGLEIFAALRRRLEEETSRLERLQEEIAKVISDNHRTILKINPST